MFANAVQGTGRQSTLSLWPSVRLSRIVRHPDTPTDADLVPLRRAILWVVVGAALVVGLVLYFKYEPLIQPLLG
jgi:hypothetical protein